MRVREYTSDELDKLEKALKHAIGKPRTAEVRREQQISWVLGMLNSTSTIDRECIEKELDKKELDKYDNTQY